MKHCLIPWGGSPGTCALDSPNPYVEPHLHILHASCWALSGLYLDPLYTHPRPALDSQDPLEEKTSIKAPQCDSCTSPTCYQYTKVWPKSLNSQNCNAIIATIQCVTRLLWAVAPAADTVNEQPAGIPFLPVQHILSCQVLFQIWNLWRTQDRR